MSWFFPWSSSIKKRACRYLLHHYLGHFLDERLTLEQLSLDLYNGSGQLRDVHLDVWSLNELLESLGAPLEITEGFVSTISVTIPWSALITENCTVEVTGLQLTCRPKVHFAPGTESPSWASCMTTSIQLAKECLKDQPEEPTQPLEGLEMFAQTIETVLRSIKVTFLDTIVRVEHTPDGSGTGLALEVHIKRSDYCDEAVKDSTSKKDPIPIDIHQPPAFVHKVLRLSGVLLYYEDGAKQETDALASSPGLQAMGPRDPSAKKAGLPTVSRTSSDAAEHLAGAALQLVQIGSFTGCVETTVKLKQNDALPGAKLELDGKMGSVHLFLSPHQLSNLIDFFSTLHLSEACYPKDQLSKSRPLNPEDFRVIEQHLSSQLHSGLSQAHSQDQGPDSFPRIEDGAPSEMFFSMAPITSSLASMRSESELLEVDLGGSMYSDYSSSPLQAPSLGSDMTTGSPHRSPSSAFPSTLPNLQCGFRQQPGGQASVPLGATKAELLLRLTLGGLTATLPHEVRPLPPAEDPLRDAARHYFAELSYFKDGIFGGRDFTHLRGHFEKACPQNHLRLIGGAVQLVCEQKAGRGTRLACLDTCFGTLEILECLWPRAGPRAGGQVPEYTELLMFKKPAPASFQPSTCPCAQIHYRQTQRAESKGARRRWDMKSSAELAVELQEAQADIDVSFLDRVDWLLALWPGAMRESQSNPARPSDPSLISGFSAVRAESPPAQGQLTAMRITAPRTTFRLQFPVPDLRPKGQRRPRSSKAMRRESLRLECEDLNFTGELGAADESFMCELSFSDLHGVYEDGLKPGVSFIRVNKAPEKGPGTKSALPKVVLTVHPEDPGSLWDLLGQKAEDLDLSAAAESPCELKQPQPSPFSSKRTMYETEEMVIPGDPEEMAEFQSQTLATSRYVLEMTLPTLHLLLPGKEFYASIYNRLNNDLLMWAPSSAAQDTDPSKFDPCTLAYAPLAQDHFRLCKSAFRLDSDSEDEDSHFHLVEEMGRRRKMEGRRGQTQTFLSGLLNIGQGRVTAFTDSKDEAGKCVRGVHGELVLDVENAAVFSVSQYKGQPELGYLCIESSKVALYQKVQVSSDQSMNAPEKLSRSRKNGLGGVGEEGAKKIQAHACFCLDPTKGSGLNCWSKHRNAGVTQELLQRSLEPDGGGEQLFLNLVVRVLWPRHLLPDGSSENRACTGVVRVSDDRCCSPTAALPLEEGLWAKTSVIYLYLLWTLHASADFHVSPRNIGHPLPPVGSAGLAEFPPTLLCLAFDPCHRRLSSLTGVGPAWLPWLRIRPLAADGMNRSQGRNWAVQAQGTEGHITPTPLVTPPSSRSCTDYVCVLDVDLLELVITTWKGDLGGKLAKPLFELRCSNNVVHVHTCADSCASLVNLVQYVVNGGDLHPPPQPDTPTEIAGQKLQLLESAPTIPPRFPAETAEINQGDLTDALLDTERWRSDPDVGGSGGMALFRQDSPASVYLFPGEKGQDKLPAECGVDPPVRDRPPSEGSGADSDSTGDNDDFCILDAPGMGIPPKDGEPLVSKLTDDPITVKDGYFSRPIGSTDLLKAPARFPIPDTRLMLREISVVWHLYGGRDFGPLRSSSGQTHSSGIKPTSARSSPFRSAFPNRPQNTWRTQGGSARNHEVLMEIQLSKMSFQHETYPVPGAIAVPERASEDQPVARQVFIVQEMEIRDRLASSQINKFLYLHTSEQMPRRTHSNMLTVKALHVRPESGLGGAECCLRVALMPLRLNIDQDALFFLKDFFTSLATGINPVVPMDSAVEAKPVPSRRGSGVFETDSVTRDTDTCHSGLELPDLAASMETTWSEHSSSSTASSSEQPIYFREFRFTSEVPIWLDYQGKHVTMEQGTFAGILIGLAQLNCSELKLKRLCCRHGLLGVDKVIHYALSEWLNDIKKNQLPGILGGVGPMHSVVQLFHGLKDLFWLPIEQYRKDGRIIRGLQRGAASFGTSTASAALELSNRLVQAIQATAETVYDILSPTPPVTKAIVDRRYLKKKGQQPADLREGVAKAYDTVREGVIDTAQTICDVATRGHEQKGITGAVGGVLRQIPPTVVKPLIVASEATSNLLGGMRNQIKPDARKEDSLKWRTDQAQE
ncbi:autophagy-related protein 2 homolog A [Narcine bancroftii]|uniref:autophagy-related protein 2 homolog A n=1 Tax=Narcine bancroftii TaxID=1343680 RepID=UPI003831692C